MDSRSPGRRLRVVKDLSLEELERIVEAVSKRSADEVAFNDVTFGQLHKMALATKETLEDREAESGVDTASNTMAQFLERQDG